MKIAFLILASTLLTGCDSRQKRSSEESRTTALAMPSPVKAKASVLPAIAEISLVRVLSSEMMTNKPKPERILTLRRDGTATKINFMPEKLRGTFHAVISQGEFGNLTQSVRLSKFENYEPSYGGIVSDIPVTPIIMVSIVKYGKRREVFDCGKPLEPYQKEAPKSLKMIEEQIDMVDAKLNWQKISNDAQVPKGMFRTSSGSY